MTKDTWTTIDGKKIKIVEMGRTHLVNTVNMLARKQLEKYEDKRQETIEVMLDELGRRLLKEKARDLFE